MKILKRDIKHVDRISKDLVPNETVLVKVKGVLHPCITSSECSCRNCILRGLNCSLWINHKWALYALIPVEEDLE